MPKMVCVIPVIVTLSSEQPTEEELEHIGAQLDAGLKAANAVDENVEFLTGHDKRFTGALVQGTMAHIEAVSPKTAADAEAAMAVLQALRPEGEPPAGGAGPVLN